MLPHPPRVTAATRARWVVELSAAVAHASRGRYAEARSLMERLAVEIEKALGPDTEELLEPLSVIGHATREAGLLADSFTVMLRTLTISEKHHGEEGLVTCRHRTQIGALSEHDP